MDGTIIDKKTFNDEYSKIVVDVPMLSYIHYLLNDNLLLLNDIKRLFVTMIETFFDEIITPIKDEEYEKYKHIQAYYLCNKTDECNYPCRDINRICKLSIKAYNHQQKQLPQKIKYKFIDLLCIHGVTNIMDIVQERIDKKDIQKFVQKDIHLYNYKEFKNGILDILFMKQNEYIMNIPFIETETQFLREEKSLSYNITSLFESNTKIIYSELNNDFICLSNAFNKALNDTMDEMSLKKQLISVYLEKEDIILQPNYSLEKEDIPSILQLFESEGKKLTVIVISELWNHEKEHNYSYYKTGNTDILTNVIVLFHLKQKDKYVFANILIDKEYYITLDELILKNEFFRNILL